LFKKYSRSSVLPVGIISGTYRLYSNQQFKNSLFNSPDTQKQIKINQARPTFRTHCLTHQQFDFLCISLIWNGDKKNRKPLICGDLVFFDSLDCRDDWINQ
jgi:hypothetical protein